ncbi:MAG: sulfatase [Planctomycetota bacterium]
MSERLNLLVFHCHDLGQYLGCYGVETVHSPNLDAFAAQGVRFARSFCTSPICSPSRAALFTGRYPHSTGVMGLCHANFQWDLLPSERHLAQHLQAAGYATGAVGVVHETRSGPERCGFERYVKPNKAAEVVDAALGMLGEFKNAGRPFYLQAGTAEPHRMKSTRDDPDRIGFLGEHLQPDSERGVWVPPFLQDTPSAREELAELQGAIRHMDEQFGRLLAGLDALGLAANTLVVFTTDHGIAFPRAKASCYEPGLQTALMLRLPSRAGWHGGRVLREMVSNVDAVPTWLEALGVAVPSNAEGRSFRALLDGERYTPREEVFAEQTYLGAYLPIRSVRTERYKLIVNFTPGRAVYDPSQTWRPRAYPSGSPNPGAASMPLAELYDLESDPWERKNRFGDPALAEVQRELQGRLGRHMRRTSDPLLDGPVTPPMHRQAVALLQGE